MAITLADFNKIWASSSPLTPYSFTENNYKQGWNFIGSTPPARQMWDFLQKNNDEKMQYLANNYLPLSGGTMTGEIVTSGYFAKNENDTSNVGFRGGKDGTSSSFILYGKNNANYPGCFVVSAVNENVFKQLIGKPDGTFTWGAMSLVPVYTRIYQSHTYTQTTNYEYTGGSVTIPANSIYAYRFQLVFQNARPLAGYVTGVSGGDLEISIAHMDNSNGITNNINMFVCGYANNALTLYLYGKSSSASSNYYEINGWYQKMA